MAVTLNQLASFLAVAREGSVSAAAERLFVTQPSISAAVSGLSRELGVELTSRVGRGVALTPAGEAFRPYAADVLGLIEGGRQAAREAAAAAQLRLRIAAVATAAEYLVPSLLRGFAELHPDVELSLEVANRALVFARLREHESDVAIAGRAPDDARIDGHAFMANDLVLITHPGDELAGKRSVPFSRLEERTWLQREPGSGTRELIDEILAGHDVRPQVRTLGSNGAIKQAVQLGLGVSIQSRMAVEQELASGALAGVDVKGGLPRRQWYVHRSTTMPLREPVRAFLAYLEASRGR
jgi:LysR family transcriptional regulator, low CO2-responsive transcriptional regulator